MKPCKHNSKPFYKKLIGPLTERARELGFALAVHGSLKRDIDLIACPWTLEAEHPFILARELRLLSEKITGYAKPNLHERNDWFELGQPGSKPHGRLSWSFFVDPKKMTHGPYVDLSVMPRG